MKKHLCKVFLLMHPNQGEETASYSLRGKFLSNSGRTSCQAWGSEEDIGHILGIYRHRGIWTILSWSSTRVGHSVLSLETHEDIRLGPRAKCTQPLPFFCMAVGFEQLAPASLHCPPPRNISAPKTAGCAEAFKLTAHVCHCVLQQS